MAEDIRTPSFLQSTWEGIKGYAKGFLAGGAFGVVVGAIVGLGLGAIAGQPWLGAALGAKALGGTFGFIGALSGSMTGVVRSRESGKVPIEDAVKAVQVSLVQGMAVEQMRAQAEGKWQNKIADERKQPSIDTGQRLHS